MATIINIDDLKENLTFNGNLSIDSNFVLLPAQVPVTQKLIDTLKDWQFSEFECEGNVSLGGNTNTEEINNKPEVLPENDKTESVQAVSQKLTSSVRQASQYSKSEKTQGTEVSRLQAVQKVYNEYMNYITSVYTHYATHNQISFEELTATVRDMCDFIHDNKRYVLRINPSSEFRSKNFLVVHSIRSTILAITIGMELHIPQVKLIELGICCILHEIGMIRLPPQLYMTDKPLSAAERAQIKTHPLIGFNIIKGMNFPLSIQLGILEHHEKENGTGYPRKLSGDQISIYAKIISVACSFEAITAPRQYKEERTTFDAMVEMLKNQNNQYNGIIIKALLYSLSLFPIGAYVFLKNGKVGIVTDVNPDNPKNPIVQIVNEKNPDGSPKTINTDEGNNKIIRVLNKKEQEDIISSLKNAEKSAAAGMTSSNNSSNPSAQAGNEQTQKSESNDSAEKSAAFDQVDLSEFS